MQSGNKRIAKNTLVNYIGLIVNTILGLFISRYVLLALGASDYGLYGVVGSLVTMLNVISTAMHTTTRRYINVEMGKRDGNPQKIFNICLVIHVGFALFIILIAETIGLFYVYNYLNVLPEKFNDAVIIFHISAFVAALGITNVPYQSVLEAFEKFHQIVYIDISNTVLKLCFVVFLLTYKGDALLLYALGMASLSLVWFAFYRIACYRQWRELVKFRFYRDKSIYKEIIYYNNYTAIGALAWTGRQQGSMMILNYFFGTLVNAAYQVAFTVENYCTLLVGNLGRAAGPQITQSYSGGNYDRTIQLTECMSRYTILLMLMITIPLFVELEQILTLWLKIIPEGALLLCHLTLIDAIVKSLCGGTNMLVHASGKVKWFQIIDSGISLMTLPTAFILYKIGSPTQTIIYLYIISSLLIRVVGFVLLKKLIGFDVMHYVKNVYYPTFLVMGIVFVYVIIYKNEVAPTSLQGHLLGGAITFICVSFLCIFIGLKKQERLSVCKFVTNRIKNTRNK